MGRFQKGDRIRVDIPDETDPDYHHHGKHGTVVKVISDDAGEETDDHRNSRIYRVKLESDDVIDFRQRDVRPPLE